MASHMILLLGAPGSGKTTLLARCMRMEGASTVCLVWDPTGDVATAVAGLKAAADDPSRDVILWQTRTTSEALQWLSRHKGAAGDQLPAVVCVRPMSGAAYESAKTAYFNELAESREGWVYATDEAETIWSLHEPRADGVIRTARNRQIRMYAAGKKPAAIRPCYRDCASDVCVFRINSRKTVANLDDLGDSEWFERATALPVGEYLYRPAFVEPGAKLRALDSMRDPIPWGRHIP